MSPTRSPYPSFPVFVREEQQQEQATDGSGSNILNLSRNCSAGGTTADCIAGFLLWCLIVACGFAVMGTLVLAGWGGFRRWYGSEHKEEERETGHELAGPSSAPAAGPSGVRSSAV